MENKFIFTTTKNQITYQLEFLLPFNSRHVYPAHGVLLIDGKHEKKIVICYVT